MPSAIEVKGLSKKFGNFWAVRNINFSVKEGEVFGFLGPNGAGKSTTIRILTTLLSPTKGTVKIAGLGIKKDANKIREKIGLVAEKIILYDLLTAKENLIFFGKLYHLPQKVIEKRADFWLKELGMKKWENKLVGTFSTGMKQRVNIARALLTNPKILFLDEPTLGLDPQTTRHIRDFIQKLNRKGITIILTTHDMHEAEAVCDRVAIIDQGRIAALDTIPALKKLVPNTKNSSLEDVFLHLTGKEIRDLPSGRIKTQTRPRHLAPKRTNRIR